MNEINSVNPEQQPGSNARPTLQHLARQWNVSRQDIWQAAQALGIPPSMASKVSPANERKLQDRLFSQTSFTRVMAAVSPGMPMSERDRKGLDKSAYLAATRSTAERVAKVEAAGKADVDLCACCEIPLPRNQSQSATVCMECGNQGHRSINGADRELVLARMHAERFRTDYLRQLDRTAQANEDRRAANRRANNWAGTLTRIMVDHHATGRCAACKVRPCPVWMRLERLNRPLATKILNDYYSLSPAQLDEKLNDGIISDDGETTDPLPAPPNRQNEGTLAPTPPDQQRS